jgi:hypothetical protein
VKLWAWAIPVAAAGALTAATLPAASATPASGTPASATPASVTAASATPAISKSPTATDSPTANPATVHVTLAATSPHYPGAVHGKVDGYAVVVYKDTTNGPDIGVLSGHVTGASGGAAALLAERFGASKFTPTGLVKKLTGSPARYTFHVEPSLETSYEVQVSASGKVVAISAPAAVYVTEAGVVSHNHKRCSPASKPDSCIVSYQVREKIPASAYPIETGKHFYLYQAVGYPKLPNVFTLSNTAAVSKVRKVNSGEFEITLIFHIPLRHHAGSWLTTFCTKDTESKDGLGLPGHHGCGDYTVSLTAIYHG